MTYMHNPRSKKYRQAFAWMNERQRQHAYLVYRQECLRAARNTYVAAIEEGALPPTVEALYKKVLKLEIQVNRLERAEYLRDQKRNYRGLRSMKFKGD